eukprot:TRINITY_DN9947_c0_g2_i1.p1 TRINITY_DN9947_c0_g2~~TRINITY_DN9947_c0_g2_i1.p1  ORF type:complete len:376 (-),score=142.74 TRINITY_DN9947_c0_g2_i1:68-1132(-)
MADKVLDEWVQQAESGNVEALKNNFKKGTLEPFGQKAQHAAVAGAIAKQGAVVEAFLEWGIPWNAADKDNRRLFQTCVKKDLAPAVKLLISKKADLNQLEEGSTPMALAIKNKAWLCMKELLYAGCKVPRELESAQGVPLVLREVQLEQDAAAMRENAGVEVDPEDIVKAENEVWKNLSEHIRLLRIKEECKAGNVLIDLERRAVLENEEAERYKETEAEIAKGILEKKLDVQAAEEDMLKLIKELQKVEAALLEAKEEDAKAAGNLAELRKELKAEKDELVAAEEARKKKEAYAEEVFAEAKALEEQAVESRDRNAELKEALAATNEDYQGWLRDKQAAAEITAKANLLLGNA